jgi:hypothetical protein
MGIEIMTLVVYNTKKDINSSLQTLMLIYVIFKSFIIVQ